NRLAGFQFSSQRRANFIRAIRLPRQARVGSSSSDVVRWQCEPGSWVTGSSEQGQSATSLARLMPRKEHGFSGQLHNFALLDIIQMGCVAQRDGRLIVRNGRRRAEVILCRGKIVHAATESQVGEDALLEILTWEKGEFRFGSTGNAIQSN